MKARFAATDSFVREAAEAVMRQVGRKEALRRYRRALSVPPRGKQQNAKWNELLLAAYDRAVAAGVPRRNAAHVAAKEMATGKDDDVESCAKHIRQLRDRRESEEKALRARAAPSYNFLAEYDARKAAEAEKVIVSQDVM